MTKAAPHCPMFIGYDPLHPIIDRPTTATPPPNIGLIGAFIYLPGSTYDPCDPPFYKTFYFGYYVTVFSCIFSIFLIKKLNVPPVKCYMFFMSLGVVNDLIFVYNLIFYYFSCPTCDTYQFFIDLVPNIQSHFWTSDFILINFFMVFLIAFAAARFSMPLSEVLFLILFNFITTPGVGGIYAYTRIEHYYQKRKKNPNDIGYKFFLMFLGMFMVVVWVDAYYLVVYSRQGFSVFPADYDPRTNFQLLLYYEAFMTPAVLLEAMTIFVCYSCYPLLLICNLPSDWNILIKLVISVLSILLSFAYVAAIMGVTIIAYEFFANFFPSWIGIVRHEKEKEL